MDNQQEISQALKNQNTKITIFAEKGSTWRTKNTRITICAEKGSGMWAKLDGTWCPFGPHGRQVWISKNQASSKNYIDNSINSLMYKMKITEDILVRRPYRLPPEEVNLWYINQEDCLPWFWSWFLPTLAGSNHASVNKDDQGGKAHWQYNSRRWTRNINIWSCLLIGFKIQWQRLIWSQSSIKVQNVTVAHKDTLNETW